MTDPLLGSVLRLRTKAKNVTKTQVRNPYRRRKKAIKLTQDERRAKQVVRDAKKIKLTHALSEARETIMGLAEDLSKQFPPHDKEYYYKLLMQLPTKKPQRAISKWCAYLSMKMEAHNEKLTEENGESAARDRVTKSAVLQKISEEWQALSAEEQRTLTADKVKELEERRVNRIEAVHNTNIAACHDARVTLKNIQTELENLHKRTGRVTLLIATRSSVEAFGDAVVHYTDPRVPHFFDSTVGVTLEDISLRMEGYVVSGVEGVVNNQAQRTQLLRIKLGNLIFTKLQDTARRANRGEIGRMNYVNFADAITVKHGIVAENWATKFENTSGLSHLEVEIALRAWETGTTRFRALTDEEWRAWLEERFQSDQDAGTLDASSTQSTSVPATGTPPESNSATTPNGMPTHSAPVAAENAPATNAPATENASTAENAPTAENLNAPTAESAGSTNQGMATTLGPENALPERRPPTDTEAGPAAKRVRTGPMSVSFINSATPAAGQAFTVPKAARKKRSDAGVPRGPRKKAANAASENTPPAASGTTTTAATPPSASASKSRGRRGKKAAAMESNEAAPAA